VQVFDGNGRYETQWNYLHRPCALYCCQGGAGLQFIVGELGPGMPVNIRHKGLGPRLSIVDRQGKLIARLGGEECRHGKRQVPGAAWARDGLTWRHLCRRGELHQLADELPRRADAEMGAIAAEAGEDKLGQHPTEKLAKNCLAPP
jgi:hypothetical protein